MNHRSHEDALEAMHEGLDERYLDVIHAEGSMTQKYQPLNEAQIALYEYYAVIDLEKRWVNSDVVSLIVTIRDLQRQLEKAPEEAQNAQKP